ncbi:MAG: hypothetical protein ABFC77_03595 [Thermoguttaceae bacterium]
MNTNPENPNLDDRPFDRLVDGEMNEAERRQLLAGLDRTPDGWRRCALAFLESQSWRETFGAIAQPKPSVRAATVSPRPRSRWSGPLRVVAAMAVCFLLAFWAGSLIEQARVERPVGSNDLAKTVPATPQKTRAAFAPSKPLQMVTVSSPSSGSFRVPAVERANVDARWLESLPPAMPDDVMQAFHRAGHQVEQHRELMPVPLQDGRRLVVPVDQVDVHYVGNETY